MNRKDSARVERLAHALAAKRTKPEPEPPAVSRVEPPTWEKRLEERALRDRWPMTQELRLKILGRLMGIINWRATTGEYMPPSYRDVNAAAKTILLADRLNIVVEERGPMPSETATDEPKRITIPDTDDRLAPRED